MLGKKLWVIMAAMFCLLQMTLSANQENNNDRLSYFGIDTGYRWDKLSNRATIFGPTVAGQSSTQMGREINSYQLGVKGQYEYCNFVVKGCYHHGWVGSGRYQEADFRGNLDGNTDDVSAALGYQFTTDSCWSYIGFIGWSWDQLNLKANHVKAPLDGAIVDVDDIRFKNRFQGPWVGSDVILNPSCDYYLVLGHEFHLGYWNGTRTLLGPELGSDFGVITGFSDLRNQHHMYGNVFRLEGSYAISDCWDLGLTLKYQRWLSSGNGRFKLTDATLDPAYTSKHIEDVEWESFAVTVFIDYVF